MRLFVLPLLCLAAPAFAQETPPKQDERESLVEEKRPVVPSHLTHEAVLPDMQRALEFLLTTQRENGTWGTGSPECLLELGFAPDTYYAWQVSAQGLGVMALATADDTPKSRKALENSVRWLCETKLPRRGDDWDIDNVWSALYGFIGCVEMFEDERFAAEEWQALIGKRGAEFYGMLDRYQALSGGWAYYDDPPYMRTPTWATSFCTALVLPYLIRAKELGWEVEDRMIERALKYLKRCAMPGGAYSYDLTPVPRISGVEHINLIQGSLGRTQVCNWALVKAGVESVTPDVVRKGLEDFFKYRKFLDHVRTRPIPHEGFYANAGYFYFFGHYYAALAIELLPEEEREAWHAQLRPHLVKTQFKNGGTSDFLDSSYLVTASTSYLILSLNAGLPQVETEADVR